MVKTEHVEAEASLDELMDECEGKGRFLAAAPQSRPLPLVVAGHRRRRLMSKLDWRPGQAWDRQTPSLDGEGDENEIVHTVQLPRRTLQILPRTSRLQAEQSGFPCKQ